MVPKKERGGKMDTKPQKRKRTQEFTRHMRHIESVKDTTQLIEPIRSRLERERYRILCEHTAPLAARAFRQSTTERLKMLVESVALHLHVKPSDMAMEKTRGVVEILKALAEYTTDATPLSAELAETTEHYAPTCASCRHIQSVIAHTTWCFSEKDVDKAISSGELKYNIMNSSRKTDAIACCITNDPYVSLFLLRLGLLPTKHEELLYEISMPCLMDRQHIKQAALSHFQRRRS